MVRLLRHYRNNVSGDVCSFPEGEEQALVAKGYAVLVVAEPKLEDVKEASEDETPVEEEAEVAAPRRRRR